MHPPPHVIHHLLHRAILARPCTCASRWITQNGLVDSPYGFCLTVVYFWRRQTGNRLAKSEKAPDTETGSRKFRTDRAKQGNSGHGGSRRPATVPQGIRPKGGSHWSSRPPGTNRRENAGRQVGLTSPPVMHRTARGEPFDSRCVGPKPTEPSGNGWEGSAEPRNGSGKAKSHGRPVGKPPSHPVG
jgi:hypothetical protein